MIVDKISFKTADDESLSLLVSQLSAAERAEAEDIIGYYLSMETDVSFAFAAVGSALVVRAFDGGEYSFIYPYELSEGADVSAAVEAVVKYAVLEEITPVFESVPRECAGLFYTLGYRHIKSDSDSPDSETYRITLENECALFGDCPSAYSDEVELSNLREEDKSDYARLWRDSENNKFWGYDFTEDYGECEDSFFLSLAERDFESYSTLSLAVRAEGRLVGEALISSFDYKGGADLAIRILPEHQRRGHARKALSLLFEIAENMGLTTLYARVYKENCASVALFSHDADSSLDDGEKITFTYEF